MKLHNNMHKFIGLAVSAATLCAFIPGVAANASPSDTPIDLGSDAGQESLVINAGGNGVVGTPILNHSFKVVKVGDYLSASTNGTNITGVEVGTTATVKTAATAAYTKVTGGAPTGEFADNPIGAVASQWLGYAGTDSTSNAAPLYDGQLRKFVTAMAADPSFQSAPSAATATGGSGTSLTISNLDPGLYTIIDTTDVNNNHAESASIPMLVGTKIKGQNLASNTLGTVNMKNEDSTAPSKKLIGSSDNHKVGDVLSYEIDSRVPMMTGYDHYMFHLGDTPSKGMQFDENSVKVSINGVAIPKYDPSKPDVAGYEIQRVANTDPNKESDIVFDLSRVIMGQKYNSPITVTYNMKITKDVTDDMVNGSYVDHSNNPGNPPSKDCTTPSTDPNCGSHTGKIPGTNPNPNLTPTVTIHMYHFNLVNRAKNSSGTTTEKDNIVGAKFTVTKDGSNTPMNFVPVGDGNYKASTADYDDTVTTQLTVAGSTKTTGNLDPGHLQVGQLDQGTYVVKQVGAANGYPDNFFPSFKVTISDPSNNGSANNAKVVSNTADQWGLVKSGDNFGVDDAIVVLSVMSLSQLPLTGGMGAILGVSIALVLALVAAGLVYAKRRNDSVEESAKAIA